MWRMTRKPISPLAKRDRQSYGVAWPSLDFTAAKLIVSFGADFLETWGASVPQQLSFADARATLADAQRFVYIGPRRVAHRPQCESGSPRARGSELAVVECASFRVRRGRFGTLARPRRRRCVAPAQ